MKKRMMTKPALLLLILFSINWAVTAQTGRVSGTVTNAQGNPLTGVTVEVKKGISATVTDSTGSATSVNVNVQVKIGASITMTDGAGKFSIQAGAADTLLFSSIGFIDLVVPVDGKTVLQVTLQSAENALDNIVVVGYSTQRKRDLTGSISTISTQDIAGLPVGGVDQIMQGKAAGVTITQNTGAPGDGVVVRIRGVGTINNNDPLYIIDGVPTKDGINQISPNDIESISILKDASSASIYGARASNGVVVITTKKGKTGKPRVSVSAYTGTQQPVNLIKMANTREYVAAYNTAAAADGREQIPQGMLDTLPDVNWQKEALKSANMSNVYLSLSGGSENTKYLLSASYFTQEGIIMNSSNKRFNVRTNLYSKINNLFHVGTNMNLAYNKLRQVGSSGDGFGAGNPGPSVMRYALFRTPATPVYDKNGNYVDLPNPSAFFGDGLNPVGLAANTDRNFMVSSILGDVYLEITPAAHLKIKTDFGINYGIQDYRQFYPTWGSPTRLQNSPNALAQSNTNNFNYNWTNTATYDLRLDKHQFNFLAGTEIIYNRSNLLNASNTNLPVQDPNFIYLGNATGTTPSVGGSQSSASLSSVFGRVDYQYNSKYLAAFSFRRDGSSRLDPNNRWGNFFSGSVGWRINSEEFLKHVDWLSNLKLRASIGQLGNQEIGYYNYTSLIGSYGYYPFGTTAASAYTIYSKGNPNVKWETSTTTDVGLDIGLLKGALNITVDYYRKVTSNLLVNPADPSSAGTIAAPAFINNGRVLNRGFDFQVDYNTHLNKDWNIGFTGNLSTIHNEVLSLLNNQQMSFGRVDNNIFVTSVAVGQPIGAFYLLQQEGIFQNAMDVFTHARQGDNIQPGDVKFKDQNKDGVINEKDRIFAGSAIPKITYGFTGTAGYKNFDLTVFFQGVQGNKIYNQIATELDGFYRAFNITERTATQSWHGEGTSNTLPRLSWSGAVNNKQTSTRFLEDGSYLRMKNVQLGYNLPASLTSRWRVPSARLYVSAQNLLTFTPYRGLDPEMATSANAAGEGAKAAGIDWGTYPSARTITVGINVNF